MKSLLKLAFFGHCLLLILKIQAQVPVSKTEQDSILGIKFPHAIERNFRIYLIEQGSKQYAVDLKSWLKYSIVKDVTEVPSGIEGMYLSIIVAKKFQIKNEASLAKLKFLYLSSWREQKEKITALLKLTKNLEVLIINGAELEEVPEEIFEIQSLRILSLESNNLKQLPAGLRKLKKLETLSLFMNEGLENVDEITHLPNLKQLNLAFCKMKSLPSTLGNLSSLEELNVMVNELSALPGSLTQLNQLRELDAHINKLKNIPNGFTHFKRLRILDLSDNQLQELPNEIGQLDSLQKLLINTNKIAPLPASVFKLKSLTHLDLSGNPLGSISEDIQFLKKLEYLRMSYIQINKLPTTFNQLENLKHCELANNQLVSTDGYFSRMQKLEYLNLSGNPGIQISADFHNLTALEILLLNHCGFTQIPAHIFGLKNLRKLYLTQNEITEVSTGILALQKLEILGMNENQITRFPASLPLLPNLKEVYFVKNNIEHLPQDYPYQKGAALDLNRNLVQIHPDELMKLANWKDYICLVPETYFSQKQFKKALEAAVNCRNANPQDEVKLDPKNHIRYAMYAQDAQQTIDLATRFLNWHSTETYMNARLIIGYILNKQFPEAEKLIEEWKGKKFSNGKDAHAYIMNEIMLMEQNGIQHVDFGRAKQLLK